MTRPVPGAGNPLTVPWIRCLDTGKRGYQDSSYGIDIERYAD